MLPYPSEQLPEQSLCNMPNNPVNRLNHPNRRAVTRNPFSLVSGAVSIQRRNAAQRFPDLGLDTRVGDAVLVRNLLKEAVQNDTTAAWPFSAVMQAD